MYSIIITIGFPIYWGLLGVHFLWYLFSQLLHCISKRHTNIYIFYSCTYFYHSLCHITVRVSYLYLSNFMILQHAYKNVIFKPQRDPPSCINKCYIYVNVFNIQSHFTFSHSDKVIYWITWNKNKADSW